MNVCIVCKEPHSRGLFLTCGKQGCLDALPDIYRRAGDNASIDSVLQTALAMYPPKPETEE